MTHKQEGSLAPDEVDEAVPDAQQTGEDPAASALAQAVGRYRQLVASQYGLVPEMVTGDTIEDIDASAQAARQAYEAISRRIAATHEARIPAGNPARSSTDMAAAALKPEAKIAMGLRKSQL